MALTTLTFSVPQFDRTVGEFFLIGSNEPMTSRITARDPVTGLTGLRSIKASYEPDPTDTYVMRRIVELLLGKYQDITSVRTVSIVDARHLRVAGRQLVPELLWHWIGLEFLFEEGVRVFNRTSIHQPDLVPA